MESLPATAVKRFLLDELGIAAKNVEAIGAGHWSECFGFRAELGLDFGNDFVVRFGAHIDDFERDRVAGSHHAENLPIPQVLDIGPGLDRYYAISQRAFGTPLEAVGDWSPLVEPTADLLDALRRATPPPGSGWGTWDRGGTAAFSSWRDFLLSVADDVGGDRLFGWRTKLERSPSHLGAFKRSYQLLDRLAPTDVTRHVVHSDLEHGNVHVQDGKITGVFDWGCALYGDHLYDLARFEFWQPWHPHIPTEALRVALAVRCGDADADVERTRACYLHIGLASCRYLAFTEDWDGLAVVDARIRQLVDSTMLGDPNRQG